MTLAELAESIRKRHSLSESQITILGVHVNRLIYTCSSGKMDPHFAYRM